MKFISILCFLCSCVSCVSINSAIQKKEPYTQRHKTSTKINTPTEVSELNNDDIRRYVQNELKRINTMARRLLIFKRRQFSITWNERKRVFICEKRENKPSRFQKYEITFTGRPGNASLVMHKLK